MSDTVLEHPLVQDYLRALSLECVSLPVAQARELREQIAGHLDEALPAGATDADVQAELHRLGSPRSLAAAALGPVRPAGWRRLRNWLGHVRWWVWLALVLVVAMASTGAGFLVSMRAAAPLTVIGSGWLYPADQHSAVTATANSFTQTTVAPRYGQRQGILLYLVNNSDWTQVILGTDPRWYTVTFSDIRVDVESGPGLNRVGEPQASAHYLSPGVIPPHSFRVVHLTWTTGVCPSSDGETIVSDIWLRVRIGVINRTEDVGINQAFAIAGGPPGPCN